MTAVSRNVYCDVLDTVVDKYNNTHDSSIKTKPTDVKSNCHVEYNVDSIAEDAKFKIGDQVRISNYKNIFAKGFNWWEIFVISKIKNTVRWTCVTNDLNGERIVGTFYEKELQKINQEESKIEKLIKRKGNKLYVKWKGYNNSSNISTDKKDII